MAAATGITMTTLRGAYITGSFTLDPASIAAGANADQTVAVPEAKVGDVVVINPSAVLTNGIIISEALVDSAGSITFTLENVSAGGIDLASATWYFALIRGQGAIFE